MTDTNSGPLLESEKVDIRRYCGYGSSGGPLTGRSSWRFFQEYGLLEFRMINATDEELVIIRQYLSTLNVLETAIPALMKQLAINQAAILKTNPTAVRDSMNLYKMWRRELCAFFNVPPGAGLGNSGMRLVV